MKYHLKRLDCGIALTLTSESEVESDALHDDVAIQLSGDSNLARDTYAALSHWGVGHEGCGDIYTTPLMAASARIKELEAELAVARGAATKLIGASAGV